MNPLTRLKASIEAIPTAHALLFVGAFCALALASVFVYAVYCYVMSSL